MGILWFLVMPNLCGQVVLTIETHLRLFCSRLQIVYNFYYYCILFDFYGKWVISFKRSHERLNSPGLSPPSITML